MINRGVSRKHGRTVMILVALLAVAGPLAAQSDGDPTLEQAIAWINSKLRDPAHQETRYAALNGNHIRIIVSIQITDRTNGRIRIHERIEDNGTFERQRFSRFYLGDIESVWVNSEEVALTVRDRYNNIESVFQYDTGSPNWSRSEHRSRIAIPVVPQAMAERIGDAFRHAVEVAPASPNDDSGDIF